ncbi:hypothetical protein ABIF24_001859 [Bradyrhizobium elkanii]
MYQTTACPAVAPNNATRMRLRLVQLPKLSRNGARETAPVRFIAAKTGDSSSRSRM